MAAGDVVLPGSAAAETYGSRRGGGHEPANLGDILERVLDKGLVIAGDIRVNLLDIELLTIKLRLVIASLETAREVGIDWWESDPWLSSKTNNRELIEENRRLRERLSAVEAGNGGERRPVEPSRDSGDRRSADNTEEDEMRRPHPSKRQR